MFSKSSNAFTKFLFQETALCYHCQLQTVTGWLRTVSWKGSVCDFGTCPETNGNHKNLSQWLGFEPDPS